MDKFDFVEKAPQYYAFLLVDVLVEKGQAPLTLGQIDYAVDTSTYRYLAKTPLVNQALKLLQTRKLVEVIPDDFGPTVYRGVAELQKWWSETAPNEFPLARKVQQMPNRRFWLAAAVKSVNEQYETIKVAAEDFDHTVIDTQWEPIPLDRTDETLQVATTALDDAIKAIEQDNGYAVTMPGEREYVLSNLKSFNKGLKEEAQIYWMQIKVFALEPLGRVITRFGPAAAGVIATAAKAALLEWLKKNFTRALDLIN